MNIGVHRFFWIGVSGFLGYKNICTPMFIAAQFTIAKYWKQPKCPSANEWIKKLWYIYTMEYYATERKKELLLCNSMDGTRKHYGK